VNPDMNLSSGLAEQQNEFSLLFEGWLKSYLLESQKNKNYSAQLLKSQSYSLLSGGKRFRPFLAYLIFKAFATDYNKLKTLCLSLEMIHTYSLIHDDLPCMDNDDTRRGKPSNHKAFSEDISLLAGDGLLSDVFYLLSSDDNINSQSKIELIKLISAKIGSSGMVSGQVFDMQANAQVSLAELKKIHTLKTANLIQAAALGGAILAECTTPQQQHILEFSYNLGMAFQIKDDLLDFNSHTQSFKSYLNLIGLQKTQDELKQHSELANKNLIFLAQSIAQPLAQSIEKRSIDSLYQLVDFNLTRGT